ncbi:MAG: hypothetical protein JW888_15150 [Pirellulales bacterium]|nr:hypothetical protein [Pirellulales bacterium]
MPNLQTALTDVLYETRDDSLRLIIGGGYGIYLKREYVRENGIRTLLREWPEARSTNDLGLFLRPELLVNSARLKPLAAALQRLGYKVISGAEKFQFAKPGPDGGRAGSLNGYFVLRFLAEDVGKHLDTVLDAILRALAHRGSH